MPASASSFPPAAEGKAHVALVTGAGSGIGKASALRLAAEGNVVGVLSHTESEVSAVCEEIRSRGGQALALVADVRDDDAMEDAVSWLHREAGSIDIVVANAGINGVSAPIDDLLPSEWDVTMAVNLRGTFLTLRHCVPHLKAAGGGAIVVVSSINGTRTFTSPGATAYAATKAGQVAMVQQLALELGRYGIRVNAVCPGAITTEIDQNSEIRNRPETEIPVDWPEGDIPITGGIAGSPEDVAEVIAFLASAASRHVTGASIYVDGGQSLLR